MGDYISYEDDAYVFLRIWESVLTRSEEVEDRVNEYQGDCHEYQTDDYIEAHYISENLVGRLVVFLAKKHGQHCGSSCSH